MSVQPKRRTAQASELPEEGAAGVRSQSLFRDVNEEIERVSDSFEIADVLEVVCECGHGECFGHVAVSRDAYEAVRRFPTRFLVRPNHVAADERIVEETAGYVVIEKVGAGAEKAIVLDPRRTGLSGPTP